MESIEGNTLLLSVDFPSTLHTFTLGVSRSRPQQFERWLRNSREDSEREIILTLPLETQSLITHTSIHCDQLNFIQFIRVEAAGLSDSTQFNTMVNIHPIQEIKPGTGITTSNIGYSKTIRLTFLLKQNNQTDLLKEHSIKFQKKGLQGAFNQLFQHLINKIEVWGYQSNCSPGAGMVSPLLNLSTLFKKYSREEESQQVDILLGLCLINSRRFTQATQHLKKVSQNYVKRYHSIKNVEITTNHKINESKILKNNQSDIFFFNSSTGQNLINSSTKKSLFRAAKVELFIAQSINQPIMTNEKIKAYYRAASYSSGMVPKPNFQMKQYDIYTALLEISPSLIRLLLKTLQDRFQPLKLTSIKSLQFLLQNVGCSVGNFLPQILKSIITNYSNQQNNSNKQIIDYYHHLIQTFINLLSTLSKSICRTLFQQVILKTLFHSDLPLQIQTCLIRIADKLVILCSADLDIPILFLQGLLKLLENKTQPNTGTFKQRQSLLIYHSQKLYQSIKNKVILQMTGPRLHKLSEWINQIILSYCQYQIVQINLKSFDNILDLINVIYSQPTYNIYPIQALLYFLDLSLHQSSLPFEKILQTLSNILNHMGNHNTAVEIVDKVMEKSKMSNLTVKEIKVLIEMVNICKQGEIEWLEQFLKCIPHSTFDEVFTLLDILLINSQSKLELNLITLVINTLLDQYTVKGKAYKKTKQLFFTLILNQNTSTTNHFINFLKVCLLQNNFPSSENKQINRFKVRKFDSKLYSKQVELFSQKLGFVCELLQSINSFHLQSLLSCQIMQRLKNSVVYLLGSNNSKIRIKGINIISSLMDCYERQNNKIINEKSLLFSKTLLGILRPSLQVFRDSRLQFNLLFFVLRLFDNIFVAKTSTLKTREEINECDLEEFHLNKSVRFQLDDSFYLTLRVREIIKLWSSLIPYLGSPWSFNRQICLLVLVRLFSVDINSYRNVYSRKLCQLIQPVLSNLLQSPEYQDRYYGLKFFATINQLINLQKQNIQKGCSKLRQFFPQVLSLTEDWNQKVREVANAIVLVGFDKNTKNQLARNKSQVIQNNTLNNLILNSFFSDDFQPQGRSHSQNFVNLSENIQNFLKETQHIDSEEESVWLEDKRQQSKYQLQKSTLEASLDTTLKILEELGKDERQSLVEWNQKNLSNEIVQVIQQDNFFSMVDEALPAIGTTIRKKVDEQQQHLDFQDLGIIQVDDEQWNDYESEVAMVSSNLPIKRKYKLSPNIGNPNKIDMPQPISITHTEKLPFSPSKFESEKASQIQKQQQINENQKFDEESESEEQIQKQESSQSPIRQSKSSQVSFEGVVESQKQPSKQLKTKSVKSKRKKDVPKSVDLRKVQSPILVNRKSSATKKKSSKIKPLK